MRVVLYYFFKKQRTCGQPKTRSVCGVKRGGAPRNEAFPDAPPRPDLLRRPSKDPCEKYADTVNAYPPGENKKRCPFLVIERTDMPNRSRQATAVC
jgi:hypothetical protein